MHKSSNFLQLLCTVVLRLFMDKKVSHETFCRGGRKNSVCRRKDRNMIDKQLLLDSCHDFEINLPESAPDKLDTYAQLLVEWNEKMNLTAITEPREIVLKHFVDSLLLLKAVELPEGASLIDVGTGAGFPSMPVKIVREDLKVTMLDSLQKRLTFLKEVNDQLGLDCTFIHSRAEDGGKQKTLREKFDFATARAVANLRDLAEYCLPYVKVGGYFVSLKGPDVEEEIKESKNAIATMGGKVEKVLQFTLPDESGRSIVLIKKISQTPPQFPRTAAKMAKKPII